MFFLCTDFGTYTHNKTPRHFPTHGHRVLEAEESDFRFFCSGNIRRGISMEVKIHNYTLQYTQRVITLPSIME